MSTPTTLKQDYADYGELRASLGFSTHRSIKNGLNGFFAYAEEHWPAQDAVSCGMVRGWLAYKEFSSIHTRNRQISTIRMFANYQLSLGKEAFVPSSEYFAKGAVKPPHVFGEGELDVLFHAIDTVRHDYRVPGKEEMLPVLFRMLYCCGMRPTEPLRLTTGDVRLDTGEVLIRESKQHKDRRIIMSEDLTELCRRYNHKKPRREYFFERWATGGQIAPHWVTNQFNIAWRDSGLEAEVKPRPYDLRHAFASRTIIKWLDKGCNFLEMLPHLSAYMGHAQIADTLYYVHLLPERLSKSPGVDWDAFSDVYPKVGSDEEN
jgi:integrase